MATVIKAVTFSCMPRPHRKAQSAGPASGLLVTIALYS
jgi:hypothetical protein